MKVITALLLGEGLHDEEIAEAVTKIRRRP